MRKTHQEGVHRIVNESKSSTLLERVRDTATPPACLIGTHNALAAKIAEASGFDGCWVSSLEISTTLGIPDKNLLGLKEMILAAHEVNAATRLPVVVDCENGYGSKESMARAVRELEAIGVAGICLEDSAFPRTNSFHSTRHRALEDPEVFSDRLGHAKSGQKTESFMMIARTESLIAGLPLHEALERAAAYAMAGADMVLIHSKDSTGTEPRTTADRWSRPTPLVSVPTAFLQLDLDDLHQLGYRLVIYANHLLRAALLGMRDAATLIREQRLGELANHLVSLDDLFAMAESERLSP